MPEDLIDVSDRCGVPGKTAALRNGRVYAGVIGNLARVAYQPAAGGGDMSLELSVRGDNTLCEAVLDFIRGLPGRTDAETLAEVGRVLDASYPNFVPSGLYSALVGG